MTFPDDYPYSPPEFRFVPPIYHPNVYKDGRLCISILHQSGDATSGEPDNETWSPVQTAETVLMSIISLLEDPNLDSPANVDAAVDLRKRKELYDERVKLEVERSQQDIPRDFNWPLSSAKKNNTYDSDSIFSENTGGVESLSELSKNSFEQQKKSSFWHDTDAEDEELEVEFSESDEDE